MDGHLSRNALIGSCTADTLANINSVIPLLKEIDLCNDVDESCKYGLFLVHTLIRNSLEYEIERMTSEDS